MKYIFTLTPKYGEDLHAILKAIKKLISLGKRVKITIEEDK